MVGAGSSLMGPQLGARSWGGSVQRVSDDELGPVLRNEIAERHEGELRLRTPQRLEKRPWVYLEGLGESDDVDQRDVPAPTFDGADVGHVHAGHVGELLLAQTEVNSPLADPLAERD